MSGSQGRRRRGTPVHERARLGRFLGGMGGYVKTAWWGLVRPRLWEDQPLVIAQAVILRPPTRAGSDVPELLLTLRSDLFGWELPGGTPEAGEALGETLVREVREETGLEVVVESHIGDWVRRGFRPHTASVYRARVIGGRETPSHETPRVAWHPVDALPDALFSWYRDPIAAAIAASGEPVVREEFQGAGAIWGALRIDVAMRWRGLPDA